MRRAATTLSLALLAVLHLLAPRASAQDITVSGDEYILQFDETNGEKLQDFIDLAKSILQRPINYDPQAVSGVFIRIVGPQRVRQKQFFQYFQSVLKAYDFIVVDYGPEGSSFLSIQKIGVGGGGGRTSGGTFFKSQAPVVDIADIDKYQHDPGTLITTSMPLKYIDGRNAMSTFTPFFDGQIEQVRNVENANTLVITGFGSHVWGAWQLAKLIDLPPYKPTPIIHKRVLLHASVDDLQNVLNDLLGAARGLKSGQQAAAQAGAASIFEIEPHIIPEPRSNALLITGDEEMVQRIEDWIDVLDVEVEPRGNTHVYRLKNTDATDTAEVLTKVLDQERLNQQQRASAGQAGAAGGGGLEVQASAVADKTSNSVIITASDRRYSEVVDILRQMDVRRPQVLIEAAIVETSSSLNDTLNVGVAVGDTQGNGGAVISNFGTPLGLTAASATTPSTPNVVGAINPPANGGTFAIFSGGDLPIPLLIQALKTDTESKVLSRPYLMTNDNQEASISTQEQTSYQTTATTSNGVVNSNFSTVEAGITLTISPTISAGNYLRLRVKIEVSNFGKPPAGLTGAPPDKTTRTVETPVTLADNHTAILGGLVNDDDSNSVSKIPFLGDLPLIGWLFRGSSDSATGRYLYVFITPHIIDTDFALLDEISAARKRDVERLGGDVRNLAADIVTVGPGADVRQIGSDIDSVFEMPSPALPPSGEQGAPKPAAPPPAPLPSTAPKPAPSPEAPGFDDVFGYDKGKKGGG